MFRSFIGCKSALAKKVCDFIAAGKYVPDDLVNTVVKKKINLCNRQKQSFILDGYPRNLLQVKFLDRVFDVDCVVSLNVNDPEILIKRLVNRVICSKCHRSYNTLLNPPKQNLICDFDKADLICRSDDSGEIILKRIALYEEKTQPIIDYYRQRKKVFDFIVELNMQENYVKLLKHLGMTKSNDHN